MTPDLQSKDYWEASKVEDELKRVFDICNGCRRCYNLCPSFNDLFARLDQDSVDGEAEKLTAPDLQSVTDLCYQCKLCFNHCPYTPPHRWEIDFPRLLLRSKAVQVKRDGQTRQDWFLGQVDRMGRLGNLFAPMANWSLRNRFSRWLMEKILGIHRDRLLPAYASESFRSWFERRASASRSERGKRVALFYTCSVNFNVPEVGKACTRVLEKNGVQVVCPPQQCCGMPFLDGGDTETAIANAKGNLRALSALVREGYDVVIPGPTCSYVLKQEYPFLVRGEESRLVSEKTYDICEYLMNLHSEGEFDTRFVRGMGKVAYQMPCHLRAQNMGYKSRDLLQTIPNTTVHVIEKCSAIDGTWGLKRQYYDLSMKVAEPLLAEIQETRPDITASDCPLAAIQITQGTGRKPLHPVQIIEAAYGLQEVNRR